MSVDTLLPTRGVEKQAFRNAMARRLYCLGGMQRDRYAAHPAGLSESFLFRL